MAKKRSNINGKKKILKNLNNLMESVGQKFSIKVGIIGEEAKQIHKGTNLTNAELGAVHEFGASIEVTEKMRGYLHAIGIHLKNDTTHVEIPARSFLREVLYNKEIQGYILDAASLSGDDELNTAYVEYKMMTGDTQIMEKIAGIIGGKALEFVQEGFYVGGYPKHWKPITEQTKKHRTGDPNNPPLQDTGDLMDSINVEVKKTG